MIRKVEKADLQRIAEIHVFGWRSAYRGIVPDDKLFNKMTVANHLEGAQKRYIENGGENYVFDDGIIKAMLTIGACRDEDKPNAFELWGIYVEPLMKRQGIGTQLVQFCESQAKERGYKEICLYVLEKNLVGRNFYEKMGFKADGHRNPKDDWEVRYVKQL